MTTPQPAVEFAGVSKSFAVYDGALGRLRAALIPSHRASASDEVTVLRDVDFRVQRGESVAIIGANGAGKSTILHLAAGVLAPSSGIVETRGLVTSVVDLGGSFLPELTGRENARMFHETTSPQGRLPAEREQAIERFAGIGPAFDRPVHTYSSGMFLRVAFACAATAEPDVLLLDEVLAVGDARFQQKCFRRIRQLREQGTTIVLVTHHLVGLAQICDRVLVLEDGAIVFDGDPRGGIDRYFGSVFLRGAPAATDQAGHEYRYGSGEAQIGDPAVAHATLGGEGPFRAGDRLTARFDVTFARTVHAPQVGFACSTIEGVSVYATTSTILGTAIAPARAGGRLSVEIDFVVPVAVIDLFVDLSVFEVVDGQIALLDARAGVMHLSIVPPRHYTGLADLDAEIRCHDVDAAALPIGER